MPFDGRHLNPTAQHLIRAKAYLQDHGWCATGPYGNAGEVCVGSALHNTMGEQWAGAAGFLMGTVLGVEPSYVDGYGIGRWNDTPGRTLDEVLAAFDRAIELAIAEGAP